MDNKYDKLIDDAQDVLGFASEVLPRGAQKTVDGVNVVIDIYQERQESDLPLWKVSVVVSGSTIAYGTVATLIEVPTLASSAGLFTRGNVVGAIAVFYNGTLLADKTGQLTYDSVHAFLTDVLTSETFMKYENAVSDFFTIDPHAPYSSAIDPLSNDAQYSLPQDGSR